MFWRWGFSKKTVKELRKNRGLTARELAAKIRVNPARINRIDHLKLKEVPEPLKSKITPILRGDDIDKIPWL
ncbi:MAG: helix-turn-helix transcriptional regulator [Syntrophomonadaceae bacterium]|jgi:transcriptional regulator with XRE-family HTH domain|nr:helix-turn-helix transcriptional regulator [Syntrophomonadaceae bacterium]